MWCNLKKNKNMKKNMLFVVIIGMIFSTCVLSQNVPGYISKNGLVGYWPFNGDTKDYSGNGNDGIIVDDPNGKISYVKNKNNEENQALEFKSINKNWNSKSSYIKVLKNNSLNLDKNYSINLFLKVSNENQVGELINKGPDNLNAFFSRVSDINNNIAFGSVPNYYNENIELDTTNWIMLTMIKDDNVDSSYLFINGNKISQYKTSKVVNNDYDLWFGLHQFGSNGSMYPFQGKMDDICIWNRALSILEIEKLYIECQKQIATSSSFDKIILQNETKFLLSASPNGGDFKGVGITNNQLDPSKNKLGKNYVDYIFKNTTGCDDTTRFGYMVYDTLGVTCTKTDTIKVNETIYDTIVTYDTITTHQTVTDTLKIKLGLTTGLYANQQHFIQMYPNPTATDLLIDFGNQEKLKGYVLIVYDASGKQVYKDDIQNQKSIVKLSSLGGKGIYLVNILDENNKVLAVKQIILE